MKTPRYPLLLANALAAAWLAALVPIESRADNENVHEELTKSAFKSSDSVGLFLSENLGSGFGPFETSPKLN